MQSGIQPLWLHSTSQDRERWSSSTHQITQRTSHTQTAQNICYSSVYTQACISTFWYLQVSMFCYLVIIWLITLENLNTFIYSLFGDFIFSQPVLYCNFLITLPSSYLLNEIQYLFPTKCSVFFSSTLLILYNFLLLKNHKMKSYALITRKLTQLYNSYIFLNQVTTICSILSFNVILKTVFYAWLSLFSLLHLVILEALLFKATFNWGIHTAIHLEEAIRQRKYP